VVLAGIGDRQVDAARLRRAIEAELSRVVSSADPAVFTSLVEARTTTSLILPTDPRPEALGQRIGAAVGGVVTERGGRR
jgi:hypothetical protein